MSGTWLEEKKAVLFWLCQQAVYTLGKSCHLAWLQLLDLQNLEISYISNSPEHMFGENVGLIFRYNFTLVKTKIAIILR